MNAWKWIQLICMGVIWLMSPAFQIANRKFNDPTKKHHNWLLWVLASVWVIAGLFLGLATYKDFSRKEIAPVFSFYMNGYNLSTNDFIILPSTNDTQTLVMSVMNTGDVAADGCHAFIVLPTGLDVKSADGWREDRLMNMKASPMKSGTDKCVWFDEQTLIETNTIYQFVPLTVKSATLTNAIWRLRLTATAKNSRTFETHVLIDFRNNVTKLN